MIGWMHRSERGAALLETVVVFPLLLVLAIGAAEFGLAFLDWLTVSNATRDGARIGSAAGTEPTADAVINAALAEELLDPDDLISGSIDEVWIFEADINGDPINPNNPALTNKYVPSGLSFVCSNGCGWGPGSRDTNTPGLDSIGVRVVFSHGWITNFVPFVGTVQWSDQTVMRFEPENP